MIRFVCAAILAVAVATPAAAGLSGNPISDGWTYRGNSYDTGIYVRDSDEVPLNYKFDVYRRDYTLGAAQGSFLAGDKVIGLGGVCIGAIIGTTVNNCAINALAKFGSPTATFAAASVYNGVDGQGSDVFGGPGFMLARIRSGGQLRLNRWDGTAFSSDILSFSDFLQFARVTEAGSYFNGSNTLPTNRIRSWQILLNIDAMARLGFTDVPTQTAIGTVVMQGQQPGGFHFVDALAPTTVPEPATWALLIGGFGLVGAVARRQRALTA